MRAYAKLHARRHLVLLDAHVRFRWHGQGRGQSPGFQFVSDAHQGGCRGSRMRASWKSVTLMPFSKEARAAFRPVAGNVRVCPIWLNLTILAGGQTPMWLTLNQCSAGAGMRFHGLRSNRRNTETNGSLYAHNWIKQTDPAGPPRNAGNPDDPSLCPMKPCAPTLPNTKSPTCPVRLFPGGNHKKNLEPGSNSPATLRR